MSNATYNGQSAQRRLLQRISTPIFFLLALLIVPAATLVVLVLGAMACVMAGIEHSEAQAWILFPALAVGFFGSIFWLVRARRPTVAEPKGIRTNPPPLFVSAPDDQVQGGSMDAGSLPRPYPSTPKAGHPKLPVVRAHLTETPSNSLEIPANMKADSVKLAARIVQLFLFNGQPILAQQILGIHSCSNYLLFFTKYAGTFSSRASEGFTFDLQKDVRCAAIVSERSSTKTAVGKTIGRMALSGVASKLLLGGQHAGLGGALLDYRLVGAETKTATHSELLIILNDLTAIVIECDEKILGLMTNAIPSGCFDQDVDAVMDEYDLIPRMADDGDRIYSELEESIDSLERAIETLRGEESAGMTFAERDNAKIKRKKSEQQVRNEKARLNAVRYLIESRNLVHPTSM